MTVLVFDFDGTLVDSNQLKHDAFYAAARGLGEDEAKTVAALDAIFADPKRGDRYGVMQRLAEQFGRPDQASDLVARYGQIVRDGILARLADGAAGRFLDALRSRGHQVFVSSATPREPLSDIFEAAGLTASVDGLYGGHGVKVENLKAILAASNAKSAVVIGDGADDAASAAALDCVYVAVNDRDNALFRRFVDPAIEWLEARLAPSSC